MRIVSIRNMESMLKQSGYEHVRTKGSHKIWSKDGKIIVIPSKKLNPTIANRLIKENNLYRGV